MSMQTIRLFFIATLVAVCFTIMTTGCATTSGIEASGTIVEDDNKTDLNKSIIINNEGLASELKITNIKSTFIVDMLKVQVSLLSNSRGTIPLQYKFDWYDAQGFEINASQAWMPFIIYSKETKIIQGVAPDPRVVEFKLKIREQDSSDN